MNLLVKCFAVGCSTLLLGSCGFKHNVELGDRTPYPCTNLIGNVYAGLMAGGADTVTIDMRRGPGFKHNVQVLGPTAGTPPPYDGRCGDDGKLNIYDSNSGALLAVWNLTSASSPFAFHVKDNNLSTSPVPAGEGNFAQL